MLRDFYAKWAIHLVQSFMATGGTPSDFKLPLGKQSATINLVMWLANVFDNMHNKKEKARRMCKRRPRPPPSCMCVCARAYVCI